MLLRGTRFRETGEIENMKGPRLHHLRPLLAVGLLLLAGSSVPAQDLPPAMVRVTEALGQEVRHTLPLSGTV